MDEDPTDVGLADFTTERLFEEIDYEAMNQNIFTSTFVERAKVSIVMEHDRQAVEAAIRCNWCVARRTPASSASRKPWNSAKSTS